MIKFYVIYTLYHNMKTSKGYTSNEKEVRVDF